MVAELVEANHHYEKSLRQAQGPNKNSKIRVNHKKTLH